MEVNNYDVVADLYDIYVPATFDIDFFITATKKSRGEVLELMSGTGRVSIPLLQAGVQLTCVDISSASNAVLEHKLQELGLHADIYQMDICELQITKKFDMIIIPFHSFMHIVSPDDQIKALCHIREHLSPGGTFICTLGNPAIRQQAVDGQMRLAQKYALPDDKGSLLLWIMENRASDDNQVVEAMQFFEEYDDQGVLKAKRLLELHFRITSKEEFEGLIKSAGFKVKALYGDYAYTEFSVDSSPFMLWVLE